MENGKLSRDFKQKIELFFYLLCNGSINRNHGLNSNFDYRQNLKNSPDLFFQASLAFIKSIGVKNPSKVKDQITEILFKKVESGNISFPEKTPEDCLANLIHSISKIDSASYKELIDNGNDMQLIMCAWGNNIKLNKEGKVINGVYAKQRAMDLLQKLIMEITPSQPFEDWELEHST